MESLRRSGQNRVLYNKLVTCLTYLPELNIKNILQGDMMYSINELKTWKNHVSFKPNVVEYNIPNDTRLGQRILQSKMGIVFHTAWNQKLTEATYKIDVGALTSSDNVWFRDASLVNALGPEVFFESSDSEDFTYILNFLKNTKVPRSVSNYFVVNESIKSLINRYINGTIRESQKQFQYSDFLLYVYEHLNKNIDEAKKQETKDNRTKIKEEIMRWFAKNQQYIDIMFEMYTSVIVAKEMVLSKLNQMKDIETVNSLTEGYVVSLNNHVVKLIDRPKFSYENFHMQRDWL